MTDNLLVSLLSGETPAVQQNYLITTLDEQPAHVRADYDALRRHTFVDTQHLFDRTDHDEADDRPGTTVLVAVGVDGDLLGGVRLAPVLDPDLGWWTGSRLVLVPTSHGSGIGRALIRAACAWADTNGVLRFEATIQQRYARLFTDLGWVRLGRCMIGDAPHLRVRWPIDRFARLAEATKAVLADVLAPFGAHPAGMGPVRFRGDDGVPVGDAAGGMVAACDAIIPSMVARDPEWAGWCAALVNLNDLAAMGAKPIGMLDAVGAPSASHLTRVVRGLANAAQAWDVPVLGGHTQVGVPAALSVTALGHTTDPIPGGGAMPGDDLTVTADLTGGWRPGYTGRQWDSTSQRDPADLRKLTRVVADAGPRAAKDVSMAGLVGTVGMMAEASGCAAEVDIADVPRPSDASMSDWLTCFPGFAMVTADERGKGVADPGPATSRSCGRFHPRPGDSSRDPLVTIRWPDGATTTAIRDSVTGLPPTQQENS
jgi:AIR synthase-related protein